MYKKRKSLLLRIAAVIVMIAMLTPVTADAESVVTVQPFASSYLRSYSAYIHLPGDGEVRVYFDVLGTGYMDELGALSITIYECSTNSSNLDDWTWIQTFTHDTTPGMLSYNDNFHGSYVSCNGYAGRYYKAYVCVWAGKDGKGDTRYFWTSASH